MKKLLLTLILLSALSVQIVFAATTTKSTTTTKTPVPKTMPATDVTTTVNKEVTTSFNFLETYRLKTYKQIVSTTNATEKEIESQTQSSLNTPASKPLDPIQKPILNIKLILFLILGFIFGNQFIFYGLCALIIFIVL